MTIRLDQLIDGTGATLRLVSRELTVHAIAEDSRRVRPGTLFVARPGTLTDGARFVDDAVAAGAVAVLSGRGAAAPPAVAHLVADAVPVVAAHLAERFYGEPSAALDLIGVTGTNGKTTVATLLHQLLNRTGVRTGLLGTVAIDDGGPAPRPADLTTPPAMETSRLLRRMVDAGCRACVMEVSSHALAQRRTAALRLRGAIFTNLSGDHLDYHGSMEAYAAAKSELFAALPRDGWAIVNVDDAAAPRMIDACAAPVVRASLVAPDADVRAEMRDVTIDATVARFTGPWGAFDARVPLVGRHNVANALAAFAAAQRLGLDAVDLAAALAVIRAPAGRLEPVTASGSDIRIFVDYAHTDDAIANVLSALRPLVPAGGRLITVFGCGGDRDRSKRPRMARAAWRDSDAVVVTSDNPRTEDPEAIIDEIMMGVPDWRGRATVREADRAAAIEHAVGSAGRGDVILIAGKGHEDYQIVGTAKRHFDDRVVAAEALARRLARPEAVTR
jgi:UDP-N-acetylmuramoyl-L-alanyl-D-glutamate--2,6-diaminopimelate ligase